MSLLRRLNIITLLIMISIVGLAIVIYLHFSQYSTRREHSYTFFTFFLLFAGSERLWENFFTSNEREPRTFSGDWSLAAVSAAYIMMMYGTTFEFFFRAREIIWPATVAGIFLYGLAFVLRWWGMLTLGPQWGIHILGESKLRDVPRRLVRSGPYRLMRHPIYCGVFLEVIGIPLATNSWGTLLFALAANVSLQVLRSYLEERQLLELFGDEYRRFQRENWAFWPVPKRPAGTVAPGEAAQGAA
jgi:protein-S-isoprenylcysteine O-methyltransferase Ste14